MSSFIPGIAQDFSQGPYSGSPSATQSLEFPPVYDCTTAWPVISQAAPHAPVLGINGEMQPVHVDMCKESPHVLVSAPTGAGKSATTRSIAAQMMRNGAVATILDRKMHSHMWAKGLPNAGYAQTTTEIGNALCELGKEVHRRNAIVSEWMEKDRGNNTVDNAPVGPRIVVVFEELNATMSDLNALTRRIPQGTYNAAQALADIVYMGRAAQVHIVANLQFPDFRVLPQAIVENFGVRVMIDYTKNAWVKLAWDAGLPIAAPSGEGRAMVVRGGKAREVQLVYLTEVEARSMASGAFNQSSSTQVVAR